MSIEAGVVLDFDGKPLHWHLPPGRSVVGLPDSRDLWDVIWKNRDRIAGIAHSHPGGGHLPGPSHEDVTTFSAVELALGRRLRWWITNDTDTVVVRWCGPDKYDYDKQVFKEHPIWIEKLRDLSKQQGEGT